MGSSPVSPELKKKTRKKMGGISFVCRKSRAKVETAIFMGDRLTSLSSLMFEISFRVTCGKIMHRACLNVLNDLHSPDYIFLNSARSENSIRRREDVA